LAAYQRRIRLRRIVLEFIKHEKWLLQNNDWGYINVELGNSQIGIIPAVDGDWNVNFN
jgi:hypothetical protein